MTDEALRSVNLDGYEPRCKACNYPGHEEHDKALLTGKLSDSEYAKIVGCTPPSIGRHRPHISKALLNATDIANVANSDSILDDLKKARERTFSLLDKAEAAADTRVYGAPVAYLREIREQLKFIAELEGKLSSQPQVNILINNPEWLELRTRLLVALDPYPEAKAAIVLAIRGR